MKSLKYFLLLLTFPLLVACFEDKTTAADKPLSNITIEHGIDTLYNIYKFDTLVIEPVITQDYMDKPLSYTWEINLEPYSHDEVFEYVGKELGKFNCRLIVENEDGKTFFPFVLYVNSDYEYGITVLSQDAEGNSMLSFMQEPMSDGAVAKFTEYDCFTRNNPEEDFAAGAIDIVQCSGRLIIACQGGGSRGDAPTIYYLNEKTMVVENMFTVPEYDDFKPTILGVPSISPEGAVYPILCENGKIYDFSVNEGVVSKPVLFKNTYSQSCLVDVTSTYYDILFFDKDNKGLSLVSTGYGPYYCGETPNLELDNPLFETENHFAGRDLVAMVKIRMTPAQRRSVGHQEFLAMSTLAETPGDSTRVEVLYSDFWKYDYVNNKSSFYTAYQQYANIDMASCPITISTPCIANRKYYTLFFAKGRNIHRWNYTTSDIAELEKEPAWVRVGSPLAQITGFEMSEDLKKTYVSFYEPQVKGLNGSVWVFDTETGKILERYNNFCYRPVKMFYKKR